MKNSNYITLPKRVFKSPLIKVVNFENGEYVNLIQFKPYANGLQYAVCVNSKNPFTSNQMFKTLETALVKFETMKRNISYDSKIRNEQTIDSNKI